MTPAEDKPQPLALYSLAGDLAQLVTLQMEMIDSQEDTSDVDREIAEYLGERIPERVDAAAHMVRYLESQVKLAEEEEQRLRRRKARLQNARERLRGYLARVLELLPIPKRGLRRLEGRSATISLWANGGEQRIDVNEQLLPGEFFRYRIEVGYDEYLRMVELLGSPAIRGAERIVDTRLVRESLAQPCLACQGGRFKQPDAPCASCGDSGLTGVPGATLAERGHHVRIS
jgi:hypothetical protein